MQRRTFLAGLSLAAPTLLGGRPVRETEHHSGGFTYPEVTKLADATDELGRLAVYLRYHGKLGEVRKQMARTQVRGGRENDRRNYYFETGESLFRDPTTDPMLPVVVVTVLWLGEFTPDTQIAVDGEPLFTLQRLLDLPEWDSDRLTAYLLGHHELGDIEVASFLGEDPENTDRYSFAIMADPQGGDPDHPEYSGTAARMRIHNAYIRETIERINELEDRPLFTLVLGDYTDHQGEAAHFAAMDRLFRKLSTPLLLEIGNHETRYAAEFTPGYNMSAFDNYFTAQRRLNGMEKLAYSFDLGAFHYVIWPDPLRRNFWETHPHYFDWLERDLERNRDRPTIFFQHVPVHPIGIDPLVHYAEQPYIKRLLLERLTRHGNVRYVFSGHVHIPIKSSVKTAVTYRGINFVNLPAAGYRPRAFGEVDYFGGPTQGAAIVTVEGTDVRVDYLDVTRNVITYPPDFPQENLGAESLLTRNKWELAEGTKLQNGSFESAAHWHGNYVYQEDERPTYLRQFSEEDGRGTLYLRANKRRYDKPGQDRVPQTLNQLTQVRMAPGGVFPEFGLQLRVECGPFYGRALVGAFVWVEGYRGHHKQYSLIYSAGKIPAGLSNRFNRSPSTRILHWDVPAVADSWESVILNPERDLGPTDRLPIDRWAINLGVWNINDGNNEGIGAYFSDLSQRAPGSRPSRLNDLPLERKAEDMLYYFRANHTAGEHVIAEQGDLYF